MPSIYFNSLLDVTIVAHVDDFLACGTVESLLQLRTDLKQRFDCSGDILGDAPGQIPELTFLGRRIRSTEKGLDWRADPKQVASFLKRANLCESSGVDTPGVRHPPNHESPEMTSSDATQHRSLVALANFISQDQADIGFATTALSRTMARPHVGDEVGVKRLAQYLRQNPSAVIEYPWQSEPQTVDGYSDSDWGGCERTRRSTSGGNLYHGCHLLGFWSRTQQSVSLSSCEAEVNALVKCRVEGLGLRNLVCHCGRPTIELRLFTDASAAVGVCRRYGSGKLKHLSIKQLWAQEKVDGGSWTSSRYPA